MEKGGDIFKRRPRDLKPYMRPYVTKKLSYGSKTLHMTSEGLGVMFQGDFADTCGDMGTSDPVKNAQTDSEDPRWR